MPLDPSQQDTSQYLPGQPPPSPPPGLDSYDGRNSWLQKLLPVVLGGGAAIMAAHKGHLNSALGGLAQGFAEGKTNSLLDQRKRQNEQDDFMIKQAHQNLSKMPSDQELDSLVNIPEEQGGLPQGIVDQAKEIRKKASEGLLKDKHLTPKEASDMTAAMYHIESALESSRTKRDAIEKANIPTAARAEQIFQSGNYFPGGGQTTPISPPPSGLPMSQAPSGPIGPDDRGGQPAGPSAAQAGPMSRTTAPGMANPIMNELAARQAAMQQANQEANLQAEGNAPTWWTDAQGIRHLIPAKQGGSVLNTTLRGANKLDVADVQGASAAETARIRSASSLQRSIIIHGDAAVSQATQQAITAGLQPGTPAFDDFRDAVLRSRYKAGGGRATFTPPPGTKDLGSFANTSDGRALALKSFQANGGDSAIFSIGKQHFRFKKNKNGQPEISELP